MIQGVENICPHLLGEAVQGKRLAGVIPLDLLAKLLALSNGGQDRAEIVFNFARLGRMSNPDYFRASLAREPDLELFHAIPEAVDIFAQYLLYHPETLAGVPPGQDEAVPGPFAP